MYMYLAYSNIAIAASKVGVICTPVALYLPEADRVK